MYRDDLAAAHARLDAARTETVQDKQRIQQLEAEIAALKSAAMRPPPSYPHPAFPYQAYGLPPRGGTVLVLGVLSLLMCTVLGPFAWSMGTEELRRIDLGLTSPHQRGSAAAGRVCGIVATCFMCFTLLMFAFLLLAA